MPAYMVCMVDTSIRLKRETMEKLKAIGSKGETYDSIINQMLEHRKEAVKKYTKSTEI